MVQITEKWKERIKQWSLTLHDLKNDEDFVAYRDASQEKSDIEKTLQSIDVWDQSPHDLIEQWYTMITNQLKHDLLNKLKTIDPYYFEQIVLKLLHRMWYGDMIETKKSKDGWIDWIINEDALGLEKIYIQTKRYTDTTVREPDIRQFIWAMAWRTQKGIFVTTSNFESKVYERVKELWFAVILIDWFRLVDLMVQYGVGVQVRQTYEIKGIDEDFFWDKTLSGSDFIFSSYREKYRFLCIALDCKGRYWFW
jgi:restriction system protein